MMQFINEGVAAARSTIVVATAALVANLQLLRAVIADMNLPQV